MPQRLLEQAVLACGAARVAVAVAVAVQQVHTTCPLRLVELVGPVGKVVT